jgi:hypothetical protein
MSAAVEAGIEEFRYGFRFWILIGCRFWNYEAIRKITLEVLENRNYARN